MICIQQSKVLLVCPHTIKLIISDINGLMCKRIRRIEEIFEGFYAKPFHLSLYSLFRMNSDGIACNTSVHSTESKIDRLIYCIKNECIGTV